MSPQGRWEFPPTLAPGDAIAVVAPSSPFDKDDLEHGLALLRGRYDVRVRGDIFERDAYLAGDDARRTAELSDAMRDRSVRAIACARGGYGAMRILDALPWNDFASAPKWIIGFSDVTALHIECGRRGLASMHAVHVSGLGRDAGSIETWTRAVEAPARAYEWSGLAVLREGEGEGIVVGGNLTLVHAMAAAGRVAVPDGAVVLLEDVTERPYRIDRMLTSLRIAGVFARASAVVLGGFTQCEPGADGRAVDAVLAEFARGLAVPVLASAPFGHGGKNEPFVLGGRARVSHDRLEFLEP